MKKLIYSAFTFLVASGVALAQPNTSAQDSVEIEVSGNTIILEADDLQSLSEVDLNKMISEVVGKSLKIQKQQNEMLARVDKQEKAGEITAEQAEEMREAINDRTEESLEVMGELMETWGEAYAERWEAWAEAYETKMEAWEEQIEAQEDGLGTIPPFPALPPIPDAPAEGDLFDDGDAQPKEKKQKIVISEDGITIEEGEEGDRPFALDFKGNSDNDGWDDDNDIDIDEIDRSETYFDIHFGFNQLLEDGQYQVTDGSAEQEFWNSTTFELGMGGKTRLGSPYSKIYLKWGGEFSWHNYRLRGDNILVKQETPEQGAAFVNDSANSYAKSKFEIVYFNIPLMLQLDLSELGNIEDSFTFGIGGYGGVRLTSRRQREFNDFEGSRVETIEKNDFFTNPFRYGVMTQIGWESWKITAKYDLSTFFQADRDLGMDMQAVSVTIGLTL
jgi:hypothetical protein